MEARQYGYETSRPDVRAHVPAGSRRVLDLGCSTGALGAELKRQTGATVVGVELDTGYAEQARSRLDRVVVSDVESFLRGEPPPEAPFDCVVAADVLEHLVDPWLALRQAAKLVRPGGTVVISVPNVLHWRGLARLVWTRRWPRDEAGPFDRTHLRWFSGEDAVDLLRQAGVRPVRVEPRYWTRGWRLRLDELLARTPLAPFLPVQLVISGTQDGAA
jgi:2-polyprenyl-3-methyl-5-hydroxy-6-metoxy-1,4-benzoquinol methylase